MVATRIAHSVAGGGDRVRPEYSCEGGGSTYRYRLLILPQLCASTASAQKTDTRYVHDAGGAPPPSLKPLEWNVCFPKFAGNTMVLVRRP